MEYKGHFSQFRILLAFSRVRWSVVSRQFIPVRGAVDTGQGGNISWIGHQFTTELYADTLSPWGNFDSPGWLQVVGGNRKAWRNPYACTQNCTKTVTWCQGRTQNIRQQFCHEIFFPCGLSKHIFICIKDCG